MASRRSALSGNTSQHAATLHSSYEFRDMCLRISVTVPYSNVKMQCLPPSCKPTMKTTLPAKTATMVWNRWCPSRSIVDNASQRIGVRRDSVRRRYQPAGDDSNSRSSNIPLAWLCRPTPTAPHAVDCNADDKSCVRGYHGHAAGRREPPRHGNAHSSLGLAMTSTVPSVLQHAQLPQTLICPD